MNDENLEERLLAVQFPDDDHPVDDGPDEPSFNDLESRMDEIVRRDNAARKIQKHTRKRKKKKKGGHNIMVTRSRGKTKKRRKRAGMNHAIAAGGTEVVEMSELIQRKIRGQLDRLPYGNITSKVADKMVDNIFSGKPEAGGFSEVTKAKKLQRRVNKVFDEDWGILPQMKQEMKNQLKPYVKMKQEERKKKVGVTKAKQSLHIYKGKGSKDTIGITDLPHDILGIISEKVKKATVTDDVLHRIDQGKTKKKKTKKKKKKKKRSKRD
jgi:hypothetical protein